MHLTHNEEIVGSNPTRTTKLDSSKWNNATRQAWLDSKASMYPFLVVTTNDGPPPTALSVEDYGHACFVKIEGRRYYRFLTQQAHDLFLSRFSAVLC